jgi:16S rRNA G527 N7-methylase RsmG
MSKKKKNPKPKKVDLLELSDSKKTRFLKKAKEKLRQKLVEAKFCQSLAETERVTINGYKIDFENGDLKGLTCDELTGP